MIAPRIAQWFVKNRAQSARPLPLPVGTVTFLFTDIEGSTRLWEEQTEIMRTALTRHDALLGEIIVKGGGRIFKTAGDSFCAAFSGAPEAVAAAVAAQQALHAERWPEPVHLRVRMALHSGSAELRNNDYFGPTLNRVARLLAIAHGGQTLLSERARELCHDTMPAGVTLMPLGEHGLKDITRREGVFQLCHPALPLAFPPLRTLLGPIDVDTPSIAVLPFVNMSQDPENEYFADGLSEELLNVLAKIQGFRVASRTSAFSFKGKDINIQSVGTTLNVANVLEGSVRKSGKRVRITTQLIQVASDSHLWSQNYDRELDDIFAVQDDIAQQVVKELRRELLHENPEETATADVKAEVQAASKGRSENAEAYRFYLQGQFFRDHFTREGAAKAIECYEKALKLDPEYALAWAGLSRACCDQAGQMWAPRAEGYARARMAAQRAIELESDLAEGHTALAWVQNQSDWDWKGADASFRRALELAPGSTLAMNGAATLAGNLGRLDEAVALFQQAVELDPLNVAMNRNVGLYGLAAGALEVAEAALHNTLQLSPQSGLTHCWLALVRADQGRFDDALAELQREVNEIFRRVGIAAIQHASGNIAESDAVLAELIEKDGEDCPYQVAEVYGYRNDKEHAFEWLERTYAQRDPGITYMKMDPFLRNLHDDPRWQPFLEKMGLADP
jgi:adenylate cyclase